MKKFWKALGITALAASLIPYRVHKDEETQTTSIDALLWQATRGPGQGEEKEQIDITFGFKSPLQTKREESVLFADDEPEAAVVDTPLAEVVENVAEAVEETVENAAEAVEKTIEDVITFDPEA